MLSGSTSESALQARMACAVACCTCFTSENMSGASRMLIRKFGSICLACACASALSMQADSAVRNCTNIGTEILYIETVMDFPSELRPPCCHARARPGHPCLRAASERVDGRDKPGHDG